MKDYKYRMVRLMHLYLSGAITEEEMEELQRWLDASLHNKALLDKVNSAGRFSDKYEAYKKIDALRAYKYFEEKTGKRKSRKIFVFARYAAIFLLLLGGALYLFVTNHTASRDVPLENGILPGKVKAILELATGELITLEKGTMYDIVLDGDIYVNSSENEIVYSNRDSGEMNMQYNVLKTPRGGEYKITLSDGSVIHLNSASQLKYPVAFEAGKREVFFEGEGYFDVAKDTKKPFYVVTNGIRIRVYGTSFNVNTLGRDKIEVVLVAGKVSISDDTKGRELEMKPSQLAVYDRNSSSIQIETVDVEPYVAWKDGYFVFEDESLEQIMTTLSLWYNINVYYVNDQLKNLHFTGHMKRYEQIDTILKAIGSGVGVTFEIDDRVIRISRP